MYHCIACYRAFVCSEGEDQGYLRINLPLLYPSHLSVTHRVVPGNAKGKHETVETLAAGKGFVFSLTLLASCTSSYAYASFLGKHSCPQVLARM